MPAAATATATASNGQMDSESTPTTGNSEAVPKVRHAWKVPRGGERDRQAVCYWAGAFMAGEIASKPALRHVDGEDIRDGSVPVTNRIDGDDAAHVAGKLDNLAHINHPWAGQAIGELFFLHFVDPRSMDKAVRLVFKRVDAARDDEIPSVDLQMFGNQIKKSDVQRATNVPGIYNLTVQMEDNGIYSDKATVQVCIEQ